MATCAGGLSARQPDARAPASEGAAVTTPAAASVDETDPRAADEGEDSPPPSNPCYDDWRCPDPMVVTSQTLPADQRILPPGATPPWLKPLKPRRRLVLFRDGYLIRIITIHAMRMARGFTPPPGSAPWQVQLQRPPRLLAVTQRMLDWEDRQACGGSLIAPGWAITAAHCVTDYGANVKDAGYRIRLGVSDISNGQEGVSYRISEIHTNPDYDPKSYFGDLALIRFEADAETSRAKRVWVQSISVDPTPPAQRKIGGARAYFYGWGVTEKDSPSAPLQVGVVELQPDHACKNSAIALCGRGIGKDGAAQCHGDSGGPLVVFDGKIPTLIGIVSHNVGKTACGENRLPGVFTRIAPYRSWLEQYTGRLGAPFSSAKP